RGKLRRWRIILRNAKAALAVLLLCSASCLEPIEPTPTSSDVRIRVSFGTTNGFESEDVTAFAVELAIISTSSRTIYVDGSKIFFEKLVDQKWRYADADERKAFNTIFAIEPAATRGVNAGVLSVRGANAIPLLDHIRGVYRAHLRMGFDPALS